MALVVGDVLDSAVKLGKWNYLRLGIITSYRMESTVYGVIVLMVRSLLKRVSFTDETKTSIHIAGAV